MLVDSRKLGVFRRRCMRSPRIATSFFVVAAMICALLHHFVMHTPTSRRHTVRYESFRQVHLLDFPHLPRRSGDDGLVDFNLALGIICAPGEGNATDLLTDCAFLNEDARRAVQLTIASLGSTMAPPLVAVGVVVRRQMRMKKEPKMVSSLNTVGVVLLFPSEHIARWVGGVVLPNAGAETTYHLAQSMVEHGNSFDGELRSQLEDFSLVLVTGHWNPSQRSKAFVLGNIGFTIQHAASFVAELDINAVVDRMQKYNSRQLHSRQLFTKEFLPSLEGAECFGVDYAATTPHKNWIAIPSVEQNDTMYFVSKIGPIMDYHAFDLSSRRCIPRTPHIRYSVEELESARGGRETLRVEYPPESGRHCVLMLAHYRFEGDMPSSQYRWVLMEESPPFHVIGISDPFDFLLAATTRAKASFYVKGLTAHGDTVFISGGVQDESIAMVEASLHHIFDGLYVPSSLLWPDPVARTVLLLLGGRRRGVCTWTTNAVQHVCASTLLTEFQWSSGSPTSTSRSDLLVVDGTVDETNITEMLRQFVLLSTVVVIVAPIHARGVTPPAGLRSCGSLRYSSESHIVFYVTHDVARTSPCVLKGSALSTRRGLSF
ncbi:membrane-associated protein, putative [Bodo saltans]|uniref:Membrane-associated protein, putative n=1 Tax=Bodo saltans TaxID=75058 RepID=A0A0S4KM97_BODSA|nr:membrane-associated protein, putative [Bodo saltans]|eukprot:CUI15545.1 membrane-associated protein, putative [Bodo saltans]